jgi:GNAT superfamily N-acetyltransferase
VQTESAVGHHVRTMLRVRPATERDIPALLRLCRQFFHVSGYEKRMSFDEETMRQTLRGLMENHVLLVVGTPAIGMLGAVVIPAFFNANELMAVETFWWVDPGHRGIGHQLLAAFEDEARSRGVRHVFMLALEELQPEKVGDTYLKNGYRLVEHSYVKEL